MVISPRFSLRFRTGGTLHALFAEVSPVFPVEGFRRMGFCRRYENKRIFQVKAAHNKNQTIQTLSLYP